MYLSRCKNIPRHTAFLDYKRDSLEIHFSHLVIVSDRGFVDSYHLQVRIHELISIYANVVRYADLHIAISSNGQI